MSESSGEPLLSVVIPAYNEEKLLPETLRSLRGALRRCGLAAGAAEIIVTDNASTDRTPVIARAEGARLIHEPVRQIARARNAGAGAARGTWLLFVDADSRPGPELLAAMLECIRSGGFAGGGATLRMPEAPAWVRLTLRGWNLTSRGLGWMAGAFIFCRAEAFAEIGGFSRELYAAEEIELSRRLKRWARTRGQRVCILHRTPLVTSARKAFLYRPGELLVLAARALRNPRRFLRNPALCYPWYDGRR